MTPSAAPHEAVAIIGMAGRFPGAANLDEFWRNLRGGTESIQLFRPEELEWGPLDQPPGQGLAMGAKGLIEAPEGFDAAFFNFNPKEAEVMDPQHRVFLEVAWSAWENAGLGLDGADQQVGVFAGASQNSYLLANLAAHRGALATFGGLQAMLTNDKDFLPARISYRMNLHGPCLNVQTACSTSLVAICLAVRSLLDRQCDVALAGAVSIGFPQRTGWIYEEGGIFSPDGHCRAFDASAAGTVPGDGAGAVVLKRLSEAQADGDHIWAVIKGCGVNNDGSRKVGFTAPSVEGQAEVIAMAQAAAGAEPASISYVEAHGTATPMGDPIEFAGLARAFGPNLPAGSCALGSVKTNLGHLDAAAGVAGLIKTVLALHHGELPPSLHFRRPNPALALEGSPFFINDALRPWPAGPVPRRAGVSSFGIGGTNAHVILEEAPAPIPAEKAAGPQLLILSARTESALETMTATLAAELDQRPELNLADAAHTLQTGRKAFAHRRYAIASSAAEAAAALRDRPAASSATGRAGATARLVFLFPGQGAPVAGRIGGLYRSEPAFRAEIDRGLGQLQPHLDFDLRDVLGLAGPAPAAEAPLATARAQPALFLVEYALARLWMGWGLKPEALIGHSLGEYAAAAIADVFSFEAGAALVAARARLMQAQPAGAMLAVRMPPDKLAPFLTAGLFLAAVNGPDQCVVSGSFPAVESLTRRLNAEGTACRTLATSHAFHSEMMDPVRAPFAAELRKLNLQPPRIPYLSNLTGCWITAAEATDPDYWTRHLRLTVRFADGMAELLREPGRVFLEVGPGRTLSTLARSMPAVSRPAVVSSLAASAGEGADCAAMAEALGRLWIAGAPIDWTRRHAGGNRRRVPLPGYAFEHKTYRLGQAGAESDATLSRARLHPEAAPSSGGTAAAESGVLPELKALFRELSGVDLSAAPAGATFLELGFDSLFLTQLRRALQNRFSTAITFRQLLDELPTLEKLAAHLEAARLPGKGPAAPGPAIRPRASVLPAPFPLTEGQKEVWFAAQMGAAVSAAYAQPCLLRLEGELNGPALREALRQLVRRHEALRLTFDRSGERQKVAADIPVVFLETDLSRENGGLTPEQHALAAVARAMETPFDLEKGPLLRAHLYRLGPQSHLLALVLHHIIGDGSTLGLLAVELGRLYGSAAAKEPSTLPPADKYSDYARREAEILADGLPAAAAYWQAQFADSTPVLELPSDHARPAARTHAGARQARPLRPSAAAAAKRLGTERGCTSFTVLLSVFTVLLHRLSGQEDLVVGVPAAAQVFDERERLAGHCVNLLPMRSRLQFGQTFSTYLQERRSAIWTAFEHWRYPFGRILRELKIARDPGRVPLANVTFNLGRLRGGLPYSGLKVDLVPAPKPRANFDLSFDLTETDDAIFLECGYSTELFEADTIGRLISSFEFLLEAAAQDPEGRVGDYDLLGEEERRRHISGWNDTDLAYDREALVPHLWQRQVEAHPGRPALWSVDERLSYAELEKRAQAVAARLVQLGVKRGDRVAVCLERTPRLIAAILGILKMGAAYVPIDPTHPLERRKLILEDAQVAVTLTEKKLFAGLPAGSEPRVCLDGPEAPGLGRVATAAVGPSDLAYVLYTSGSTGRPKGVAVGHGGIAALLAWAHHAYAAEELSGFFASTSICFDLSVFELFTPLCRGGQVILADDPLQLPQHPGRGEVTLLNTVPSAMFELLRLRAVPPSVRIIVLGGEAVPQNLVDQIYRQTPVPRVFDLYGPTEDTVYSMCALRRLEAPPTIGRPLPNKQAYVLDRRLQPLPVGVPGELFLSGEGMAQGYWRAPALTAEKFLVHPFRPGQRIYRTGDLARRRADGEIEFLGRIDHQIKLRGYRIELGEVEQALRRLPGVREAVAILREDQPGQKRLVAYAAVPEAARAGLQDWRRQLEPALPAYMVPAALALLEQLPHNANGKIDRKKLPRPEAESSPAASAQPETPAEQTLAGIWRDLLGLARVGREDNFFESGGHSLLATQLLTRVTESFGVELPLRAFFDHPQLSRQAEAIETAVIAHIESLAEDDPRLRGAATGVLPVDRVGAHPLGRTAARG